MQGERCNNALGSCYVIQNTNSNAMKAPLRFCVVLLFFKLVTSSVDLHFDKSYEHCAVDFLDFSNKNFKSQIIQSLIHSNPQHLLWTVRTAKTNTTSIQLYAPYKYKEKCAIIIVIQPSFVIGLSELNHPATRFQNPKSIFIFIIFKVESPNSFKQKLPVKVQAKVLLITLDDESGTTSIYVPSLFGYMTDFQFTKIMESNAAHNFSLNLKRLENQWDSLNPVSNSQNGLRVLYYMPLEILNQEKCFLSLKDTRMSRNCPAAFSIRAVLSTVHNFSLYYEYDSARFSPNFSFFHSLMIDTEPSVYLIHNC